ncbi:MAG: DNA repair protein RecO [Clostridiales bacterium]|nr:DNA repair protein RecO [Clostridiales bacterium]
MIDFTDKCVTLKISDYRENDRLAKVLTAEHGMVTVLLRGVKKAKAKLKPFAQEFTVYDARLTANKGAFLTAIDPFLISDGFSLCADLKVFTAASVAAEATVAALGDEQTHAPVFLEFLKLLQALRPDHDPYYQAAVYMTRLLELAGFYREYTYNGGEPVTPVQMLGYAQKNGYEKVSDRDMSRRALKFVCGEFQRNFDTGLKSVDSIDLYGK